jgi:hypothetical protein
MLSSMVKDHKSKQSRHNQLQEKRKQEAIGSLYKLNEGLLQSVNQGVSTAYKNQRQLDNELKQLQVQTTRFVRLANSWSSDLKAFHSALKELGDVENWATSIESDLKDVVQTIDILNNPEQQTSVSAGSNTQSTS